MNTARMGHSATLLPDGQVLAAGGESTHQQGTIFLNSAELYTP
jgi:galactose oxidase-like protein